MIQERPVLSATTEIVVAALSSKTSAVNEDYGKAVAAFAETIYEKLYELEMKQR